jgi:hypothetical protein
MLRDALRRQRVVEVREIHLRPRRGALPQRLLEAG